MSFPHTIRWAHVPQRRPPNDATIIGLAFLASSGRQSVMRETSSCAALKAEVALCKHRMFAKEQNSSWQSGVWKFGLGLSEVVGPAEETRDSWRLSKVSGALTRNKIALGSGPEFLACQGWFNKGNKTTCSSFLEVLEHVYTRNPTTQNIGCFGGCGVAERLPKGNQTSLGSSGVSVYKGATELTWQSPRISGAWVQKGNKTTLGSFLEIKTSLQGGTTLVLTVF